MAVPKKKTSRHRKGKRRSFKEKLIASNPVPDSVTGDLKLSHHLSRDGYYRGIKILRSKAAASPEVV